VNNPEYFLHQPSEHLELSSFLRISDISKALRLYIQPSPSSAEAREYLIEQWRIFILSPREYCISFEKNHISGTRIELIARDILWDRWMSTHPKHKEMGVESKVGTIPQWEWFSLFAQVFERLRLISPGFADELDIMIQKIVPYGVSHEMHNSASFNHAIGQLYLSYPTGYDDPATAVLEAVIHESNHNKLNLISFFDPLFTGDREEKFYSPYRPDARHIMGIYYWLHAMVGVYYTVYNWVLQWVLHLDDRFLFKSLIYVMKNQSAIKVLQKYGKFTELGQTIFEEMQVVHSEILGMVRQVWPSAHDMQNAAKACKGHFAEVQRDYPFVLY
jgi:hypothetical protein